MPATDSIRARIAALAADAHAIEVGAIAAAVAAGDEQGAFERVCARLTAGEPTTIADVIGVVPTAPTVEAMLGVIGALTGDRAATAAELVATVERGRFPAMADLRAHELGALLAAWRLGDRDALRARIVRHARRLVRAQLEEPGTSLAAVLVRELGDPHVTSEAKLFKVAGDVAAGERTLAAIARPIDEVIAALPEIEHGAAASGLQVRVADRPGRNEPCHCGSGKKYKKCHADADDETSTSASPVAGMSWDDWLTRGAPQLTVDDLHKLPLGELARVDLDGLQPPVLIAIFGELCAFRRWDLAARAIAAVRKRETLGDAKADELVDELAAIVLGLGDHALVAELVALASDPAAIINATRLELALRARPVPDVLSAIEELAVTAIASADVQTRAEERFNIASALLGTAPAIGIVFARGCLDATRLADSEGLLDLVEDARDRLALPPGDPGWDVLDDLLHAAGLDARGRRRRTGSADDERHKLAREAAELRASVAAEADRAAKLESELARQRAALDAITTTAARTAGAAADPDVARARELRAKVDQLEAQIREGNEERVELKKKLASGDKKRESVATGAAAASPVVTTPEDDDAAEGVEELATQTSKRGILIPRFDDAATRALGSIPVAVAAEALRTIGELAAGEGLAWHRVKQAKDMRTPLFMARVGIHHRLLFRVDDRLAITDIVPREGLLHALKRLRSG